MNSDLHRGGQLKPKLVSLLFALALAQYAPAQSATSVDLVGVGGTFPLPIYAKWFAEYGTSNAGVQFHYLPRGSAEGISNVSNGRSDFGGSDVPTNDEELAKAPTKLLQLPSVVGAVVPIYNLPGIRQELRFTCEVLAGIYLGTVRNWNDPAIASINPGVSLPHQPIEVFYRGDPSGTSYIWTEFLSKVSGQWKSQVGYGITVKRPAGEPSTHGGGNLARSVEETPNSIWVCRAHVCSRTSPAIRLHSELGRKLYEGQLEEFVGSRRFQGEVDSRRRFPRFIDQRLRRGFLPGRELHMVFGSEEWLSAG
jgi:ABC-type phosphate transport system substrate-binding protein